ncbi:FeoA family protein [Candidatus Chloroploca asiatica]|uniref:Iron transporter FeoA n=1 Tax=Candidatus Chloroploca asiatica TaxID=1506545 RepID=A0A2H3KNQ2_9CHLR|nr:FeoA family protein [Candidatus Chloroploca asiatica]PDV99816.1 iron transporter FeoA [Candidatus Chloroploca asiatica]
MHIADETTLPLSLVEVGAYVRIVRFNGGMRSAHRLAELGVIPGTELTIITTHGGGMVIGIGDTRLALGRGLAHKVLVTFLERKQ